MAAADYLAGIPLFMSLSEEETKELEKLIEVRAGLEGQELFRAGDPADAFYVISQGRIRLDIPELGERRATSTS